MPVVVNNDTYDGNFKFQNVWQDVKVLDAVSHVNMTACDYGILFMDSHKTFGSNTKFTPQHGSPPGPMTAHVEAVHHPFPRNICLQICHGSVHKIDRFNYIFVNHVQTQLSTKSARGFYFLRFFS